MTNLEMLEEVIEAVSECDSIEEVDTVLEELKEQLELNEELVERDAYETESN